MNPFQDERTKRFAPYVAAYALGVLTFWGGWAILAYPDPDLGRVQRVAQDSATAVPPIAADILTSTVEDPPAIQLREAAQAGDHKQVLKLIAKKVDVNARDVRGRTPLILAAAAGRNEIVTTLIDSGANMEAAGQDGRTPLMAAAATGKEETVQLLIDRHAQVKVKGKNGTTAHDLAIRHKHDAVARLIANEIDERNRDRVKVTRAQFLLAKLGYRPGSIDGTMGRKTKIAIVAFQKNQDMIPDGHVTEALLTALDGRHKAMENSQVVKRATSDRKIAKRRGNASRKALRRASSRSARKRRDSSSNGGWFSRTTKWLGDRKAATDKPVGLSEEIND